MVGKVAGDTEKHGLVPSKPQLAEFTPVIEMVGVSLPVPMLLMHRYAKVEPPAGSLSEIPTGLVV